MVRPHANVDERKIIHLEDRFQRNSLHKSPKILKKDFGNPIITITLKKLNHNRMEFCKSNQQLKYLAAVQRTGIYVTFKELRLNDQKSKFHRL